MKYKVLVLGLDGATFDIIMPMIKKDRLPNIANLIEKGVWGNLESVIPPVTASAWVSFATGKNSGKHGIFDWVERKNNSYDFKFVTRKDIKAKSLWKILSLYGKRVGLFSVPLTHPPERINGFIVSGFPLPKILTSPKNLYEELKKNIEEFEKYVEKGIIDERVSFEDIVKIIEKKTDTILYLMKNFEWDFFMGVFMEIDWVQHYFWKYMDHRHPEYRKNNKFKDVVHKCYEKIDASIGEILKEVDHEKTIIFLMSDHGFGLNYSPYRQDPWMHKWLIKNGYLRLKVGNKMSPLSWLYRLGIDRGTLYNILAKLRLVDFINRVIPKNVRRKIRDEIDPQNVDWKKTKAYSYGVTGKIFINLKGREPEGSVELKEYERIRENIINKLKNLREKKTGENMISGVYRREDVYHGKCLEKAPDIVFLMREVKKNNIKPDEVTQGHRLHGIFVAKGPIIKKGLKIENVRIYDLFPTILHIFNIKIPKDVDGRVLHEIFV